MKLVYLHQYFKFPSQRGSTRSYDLATSFVKEGIDVVVISTSKNERYKAKRWNIIKQDGLEVHFIHSSFGTHLSYFRRIMVFIKFMWFATFRLLKIKADIVVATSTPLTIGIPALLKKIIHKTPYIFEVRDVWPEAVIAIGAVRSNFMKKWLFFQEKTIYRYADHIVPLSTDMQQSIVDRFPAYANKANIVIENISEVNRFKLPNIAPKNLKDILGISPRFSVLYAGTFGKVNGLSYVIDLAEQTIKVDSALVYILVGAGGEKEKLLRLAAEKGVLNRNLYILDPISKDELPSWYQSIDMGSSFVIDIKELWANSANKFFDSLAAGKPILINHRGWQAETIERDNIGYVLPARLDQEGIKKFLDYTYDRDLHQTQRENAYNKAASEYSLQVATAKYTSIFKKLLD